MNRITTRLPTPELKQAIYLACILYCLLVSPLAIAATLKSHPPVGASISAPSQRYLVVNSSYLDQKNLLPYAIQYGTGLTRRTTIQAHYGLYKSRKNANGRLLQTDWELGLGYHLGSHLKRLAFFTGMTRGELIETHVADDTYEHLTYDKYFAQLNIERSWRVIRVMLMIKGAYTDKFNYRATTLAAGTPIERSTKPGYTLDIAPKLAFRLWNRLSMELAAGLTEIQTAANLNTRSQWWSIGLAYRE